MYMNTYKYKYRFVLPLVHWSVLPSRLPTGLAMYTVVAFSSSLDVTAIQALAAHMCSHLRFHMKDHTRPNTGARADNTLLIARATPIVQLDRVRAKRALRDATHR